MSPPAAAPGEASWGDLQGGQPGKGQPGAGLSRHSHSSDEEGVSRTLTFRAVDPSLTPSCWDTLIPQTRHKLGNSP